MSIDLGNVPTEVRQEPSLLDSRVKFLISLLHMQDQNNRVQHAQGWVNYNQTERPDYRMALMELTEVWDHLPCGQWWKKGDQSELFLDAKRREQAALEIVDAIHFALSHLMVKVKDTDAGAVDGEIPYLAKLIAQASIASSIMYEEFLVTNPSPQEEMETFNFMVDTAILNCNHSIFTESPYSFGRLHAAPLLHESFQLFWESVFLALNLLDYSFDQTVALYIAKNRLNTFRVFNGYTKKPGEDRYIKLAYDGGDSNVPVEDNFHLPAIARAAVEEAGRYDQDLVSEIDKAIIEMYSHRPHLRRCPRDSILRLASSDDEDEMQDAFPDHWLEPIGGWSLVDTDVGVAYHHAETGETVVYAGVHPHYSKDKGFGSN